jgi:kynurenine formamidase
MHDLPSYRELPLRGGARCAWHVWEGREALGALNLLTPERIIAATREVRRACVFSLNLSLFIPDPPLFGRPPARHEVIRTSDTSQDDLLHSWNTQSSSQWDGFRHVHFPGQGYFGGLPDARHGVDHWARNGIVARGTLVDIGRWRTQAGRPLRYDAPDPITASDLVACLAAQRTAVEPGDILLLRTGWLSWYLELNPAERADLAAPSGLRNPGLAPSEDVAELLWDMHVAAVAADNPALEVWPIGSMLSPQEAEMVEQDRSLAYKALLHLRLVAMLGIVIGELFDLEALAEDCMADGCYTCLLTSSPLNLPAGVASPPNVLAIK